MSDFDLSVRSFKEFLESLTSMGTLKETTAKNLKNSSSRLLTVIKEEESADVTKIDIDDLAIRYALETDPKPSDASIAAYKSRTESAIKKFLAYQSGEKLPYTPTVKKSEEKLESNHNRQEEEKKQMDINSYDLPVVLRPESGITVTINGIPKDITNEEAERIASILKVYVRPQ